MTPYYKYVTALRKLYEELIDIQESCEHPTEHVTKTPRHDNGWDYDEYWTECQCNYCGKGWREDPNRELY